MLEQLAQKTRKFSQAERSHRGAAEELKGAAAVLTLGRGIAVILAGAWG